MTEGRASRRSLALTSALGALAGVALLELALTLFWPQEDLYLYEYRDGLVFNRPNFDEIFAVQPASLERLRHVLPSWLGGRWDRKMQFFKRPIRTNARGERDDQIHEFKKTAGRPRILNLGDSISFGWPVELGESYPKQLERLLPGSEVVNCSVIAADTAQIRAFYRGICGKYEADLVVVQLTIHRDREEPDYLGRDPFGPEYRLIKALWQSIGLETLQHLTRDPDGTARLSADAFRPPLSEVMTRYFQPRLPLYRRSQLVRLIENRWFHVRLLSVGGSVLKDHLLGKVGVARFREADESAEKSVSTTRRYLGELAREIQARGARVLILFVPTGHRARELPGNRRPDLEELKRELKADGLPFLDMADEWSATLSPEKIRALYNDGDFHPKASGYRQIAERLAREIRERFPSAAR